MEITIGFLLFLGGFLLGRINLLEKKLRIIGTNPNNSFSEMESKSDIVRTNTPNPLPQKISIDESKFVTDITTNSLQKDFEEIGRKISTEDSISSSVSKLSQLKKFKE